MLTAASVRNRIFQWEAFWKAGADSGRPHHPVASSEQNLLVIYILHSPEGGMESGNRYKNRLTSTKYRLASRSLICMYKRIPWFGVGAASNCNLWRAQAQCKNIVRRSSLAAISKFY